MAESYVIGVDFGSDSVRALIVNTETGENVGQGVACYPRWKAGLYQHPEHSIFRQHPLDYLESLETEFGKMKMKKLDVDKVHKFVKMLLPISEKDGDRKVANIQEMRNELMMRYLNAPDLQVLEPSAYRFVNAVSDFSTHRKPSRGSEYYQENMFMKVVDGDELIDKAYAICDAEV